MYINLRMFNRLKNLLIFVSIILFFISKSAYSEIIKKIEILGNDRITNQTILMFSNINLGQNINENDLNKILKNLYNTNFFKNVSVNFKQNLLSVVVEEYPIIQEIIYKGIKSKNLKEKITSNVKLINRSSYNEIFLKQESSY